MKILLINPAPPGKYTTNRKRGKRSSFPQLNLLLLAAYTPGEVEVKIIDEHTENIDFTTLYDLVGITVMTPLAPRAYEIADRFRKKGTKVVLGGIHTSILPEEASLHADSIVIGEGDALWPQLISDFRNQRLKPRYQAEGFISCDNIPTPRRDLIPRQHYVVSNTIQVGRGCPHNCEYCSVTLFWGSKFRHRPVEEVINEISQIPDNEIVFVDDNIIGNPNYAKELFRRLIPLKKKWHAQCTIKLANDEELLELAVKSGCQWMFIGIESVSSNNLASVGKKFIAAENYQSSIEKIQAAGINVLGSFILGMDFDTTDCFQATIDFCEQVKLRGANFYIFTPFPGTQVYQKMENEKRIINRDWNKYDCNHVVIQPKNMSPEELLEGYIWTYKKFYSVSSIAKRFSSFTRGFFPALVFNLARKKRIAVFEAWSRS